MIIFNLSLYMYMHFFKCVFFLNKNIEIIIFNLSLFIYFRI